MIVSVVLSVKQRMPHNVRMGLTERATQRKHPAHYLQQHEYKQKLRIVKVKVVRASYALQILAQGTYLPDAVRAAQSCL